jgi:hypothetical protein
MMTPTVNKTQKIELKDKVNYGVLRCATVLKYRLWRSQAALELKKSTFAKATVDKGKNKK